MNISQEKITSGALACLIFSFLSGFSTLFLFEVKVLKQDVWLAYIMAVTLACGVLLLLSYVQKQYPQLSMVQVLDRLLGKWLAKAVLCIYLVYILEIQGLASQALTSFYRTVVLPNTTSNQILLLIVLTTSYAVYLGLGAIVRTMQITLPFFLISIIVICLFIIKEVDSNPFLPPLQHRIEEIGYCGLISLFFPFGKSVILSFLFSHVTDKNKLARHIPLALALSGLYLIVASYLTLGSLGMHLTEDMTFPFFSAIQLVKFGEYIERIEIMIIGIWTIFTLFEIIILQLLFTEIFCHVFGLPRNRGFILPIGLLFFAISQRSFVHLNDLANYNVRLAPFTTVLPMAMIPLIMYILTMFQKKRKRSI
ncbi:GerAB/ArcD/ProY family transporter [Paenibacillus ferrarius]|uniref:GerAB/ArcD/ProY family transporter n=1 Tax=Paenibacillus ferrarius TaxID=1469647 RepID=UPI003D2D0D60